MFEQIKKYVIEQVLWAEKNLIGESGSVKREAVITRIADLIDIPVIPNFIEEPIKHAAIGYIIDLAVEKLNWITGYSFTDVELDTRQAELLGAVIEAPVPIVVKSLLSRTAEATVDERINALLAQYGLTPDPVVTPELPQQETIQTPAPVIPAVSDNQFDKIVSFVLIYEGGYVNDPDDPGGETNRGITAATLASAYAAGIVKHNVVKNLTRDEAVAIYKARYYTNYGYDKFPYAVSLVLTDTTVNMGRGGAASVAQKACNTLGKSLTVDSKWGPLTQAAVEALASDPRFARTLLLKRKDRYDDIIVSRPASEKYRQGWYNRLKALAAEAGTASPV
jgi:lysozyme family protein